MILKGLKVCTFFDQFLIAYFGFVLKIDGCNFPFLKIDGCNCTRSNGSPGLATPQHDIDWGFQ